MQKNLKKKNDCMLSYSLFSLRKIAPNSNSKGGVTIQRNLALNPSFHYLSLSLNLSLNKRGDIDKTK